MMQESWRLIAAALLTVTMEAGSGAAQAQGNPSADQIINSLRPGAGMLGGTRGIRPVAPSAEPASPPPSTPSQPHASQAARTVPARPTPGPAAVRTASAPSVNLTVQFTTNSAELTPSAVKTLSELGRALSSDTLSSYHFRIEGHTDTVGAADTNKALSDRRAQAVVAFLSGTFKIDPSRLEAVGMGEEGLLIQTPPNTPESRNRRVQVINLGA